MKKSRIRALFDAAGARFVPEAVMSGAHARRVSSLVLVWFTLTVGGCGGPSPGSQTSPASQQASQSQSSSKSPTSVAAPVSSAKNASAEAKARNDSTAAERLNPELDIPFRLIRQHQTGAARVRLRNHLTLHPEDGQAHFLFGLSYHREKKYALAITHFDRALELAPQYPPIQHFRGWAKYYLGELDDAKHAFETFLQLKPGEPDSQFGLGLIALDEHDLDSAKSHFAKSIAFWTAEGDKADLNALSKAHARLSEVLEQQNELREAMTHLQKAVELNPDAYEAIYRLYRLHVRLGESEQAERVHQQYLAAQNRVRPGTSFPE